MWTCLAPVTALAVTALAVTALAVTALAVTAPTLCAAAQHAAEQWTAEALRAHLANLDTPPPDALRAPLGERLRELPDEALPMLRAAYRTDAYTIASGNALMKAIEHLEARVEGTPTRLAARLSWHREVLVEAYRRDGARDPAWDADALAGLEAMALQRAGHPAFDALIPAGLTRALAAGCEDPIVALMAVVFETHFGGPPPADGLPRLEACAAALLARGAHPALVGRALTSTSDLRRAAGLPEQIDREQLLTLLGRTLSDDQVPDVEVLELALAMHRVLRGTADDPRPALEPVLASFAACEPRVRMGPLVRGHVLMAWAREVRGPRTPMALGNEERVVYNDRKMEAALALNEAVADEVSTALGFPPMFEFFMTGQQLDRDAAAVYFVVGIQQDPDALAVCQARFPLLTPRYGGRFEDAVAFGRACLRAGNFEGRVATLLLDVHEHIAGLRGSKRPGAYLRRDDVWLDLQATCDEALKRYPMDRRLQQRYARVAALAGKKDVARRAFAAGGERPYLDVFGTPEEFAALRAQVMPE